MSKNSTVCITRRSLDDLTKAMGRKSFDEDLKALPEKGGYLCLFDVDKFKNINDTLRHLLGDEVMKS